MVLCSDSSTNSQILVDSIKRNSDSIMEYVEENKGNIVEIPHGEHFPFNLDL